MIDFPNSPTVGQQFTAAGATWTWDGVKWEPAGQASPNAQPMNDNRLINGDMRVDQRNNGATGTTSNVYTVDRWEYFATQATKGTWGRNTNAANSGSGFTYCLGFTSSSAYTPLAADYFCFGQAIEADMIGDFAFGTSVAQSLTLSFWVQSSKTGTFSGALQNYAETRTYPFSYSIPTAGTWIKIVITIPGDTAGTWVMSGNGGSMYLMFDLGSGANFRAAAGAWTTGNILGATGAQSIVNTNGANFYVTGVKLETGSIATPFGHQSLAKNTIDCQRYYQVLNQVIIAGYSGISSMGIFESFPFPTTMRATPTATLSGFVYSLASGAAMNNIFSDNVTMAITSNAVGNAYGQGIIALSAEL